MLPGIDATLSLVDPIVGDRLGIGLALAETGPSPESARFAGLRLLPAAQGAVWRHLAEGGGTALPGDGGLVLGPAQGVVLRDGGLVADGRPAEAGVGPVFEPGNEGMPASGAPPSGSAASDSPLAGGAVGLDRMPATAGVTPVGGGGDPVDPSPDVAEPPAAWPGISRRSGLRGHARGGERRGSVGPSRRLSSRSGALQGDAIPDVLDPEDGLPAGRRPGRRARSGGDRARSGTAPCRSWPGGRSRGASAGLHLAPNAYPLGGAYGSDGALVAGRQAVLGAAAFLAGRYTEAAEALESRLLDGDDETALWRAVSLAAQERWDEALPAWRRGHGFLEAYPVAAQAALGRFGVALLLQTGRIEDALALIDRLTSLRLDQAAAERIRNLEAMALERDGAIDEARAIWQALARAGLPETRSLPCWRLSNRLSPSGGSPRLRRSSGWWRTASLARPCRRDRSLATAGGASPCGRPAGGSALDAPGSDGPRATAGDRLGDHGPHGRHPRWAVRRSRGRPADATSMLQAYRRFAELVPPGADGDARVESLALSLGGDRARRCRGRCAA
jgi:hypothetical protein